MKSQEKKSDSGEVQYLSKRVMVNGQFVTLYSANGQTWVSSPEEIPDLMARLDNIRIMLSNGEKEGEQPAKAEEEKPAKDAAPAPAPVKLAANKYRMKGPKPRPILRQGGVVIVGTPIEPISASGTVARFGEDGDDSADKKVDKRKAKTVEKKVSAKSAKSAPVKAAPAVAAKQNNQKKGVAAKQAKSAPVAKSRAKASASAKERTIEAQRPRLSRNRPRRHMPKPPRRNTRRLKRRKLLRKKVRGQRAETGIVASITKSSAK